MWKLLSKHKNYEWEEFDYLDSKHFEDAQAFEDRKAEMKLECETTFGRGWMFKWEEK